MNDDALKELYAHGLAHAADAGPCPDPEALRAVAEDGAGVDKRLELLRHVGKCLDCQRDLALLGQVADTRPRVTRLVPRWPVAAAAAIVVIGAASVLRLRAPADPVLRGGNGALVLVSPSGGVVGPEASLLVWRSIARAVRYEVEISDTDGNVIVRGSVPDTVTPIPKNLAPSAPYRWRVSAVLADGSRVESALGSFSLGPP